MKVLVIGGTADGRYLATELHELGFNVTYSIAGIVRQTNLACPVISGGFTQFGGLAQYVIDNNITHLVDVTHPFAQTMSNTIAEVSAGFSLPSIRFHRKQWSQKENDQWIEVTHWDEVIQKMANHRSVFITSGQISQTVMDKIATKVESIFIRTAMPLKINLPDNVTWIKAIGPFQLTNEQQLIKQYQIDAIISKNSGGDATYAKIQAAADAGIPVYQFKRPQLLPTLYQFEDAVSCLKLLFCFKGATSEI